MPSTYEVQWFGMRLSVPGDWEIVRHSVNVEKGRLGFVDRRRQRMQLSWSASTTRPDSEWIFNDFRSRDRQQYDGCTFGDPLRMDRWSGYRMTKGDFMLTRAGFYDGKNKRWIDVALPWPCGYDSELESAVLGSFRIIDENEGSKRFCAFDLDVDVPSSWILSKAEVLVGDVTFTFSAPDGEARARRIAMPEAWFDGHLEEFLKRQARGYPGECSIAARSPHEVCEFRGKERMFHPRWIWNRRQRRVDRGWECKADHAVYQLTSISYPSAPVAPESITVRCCPTESAACNR